MLRETKVKIDRERIGHGLGSVSLKIPTNLPGASKRFNLFITYIILVGGVFTCSPNMTPVGFFSPLKIVS